MSRNENRRRLTARQKVYNRLSRGTATNVQLSKVTLRFGARIKELRDSGYSIIRTFVKPGVFSYTLEPAIVYVSTVGRED